MLRRFGVSVTVRAIAVTAVLSSGLALASSPSLSIILPRGAQRGTESVLTFSGARLADAEEILFFSPGFEVTKIEAAGANQAKVTVKIAPDCRLGEHVAHVRTKSGISDYRTFYVGALPIAAETEPNNDFAKPQSIGLNVTVHGVVTNEDVDYYVVEAKKGQRIAAEIEGMRLGNTLFDPYLAILDSKRFELASSDDTPLVKQDAAVSVIAPADGKYIIEIRESAYGGNGNCRYNAHIGTFPRPTGVYPAGGKLGEETEVRFLGDASGEIKDKFPLPAAIVPEYSLFATADNGISPSGNPFRLFEYGNALEVEPNNEVKTATPAQLPLAFNGIISEAGDHDYFKFSAKKGQVYEIECFARRLRSPLDPVMNLFYADGRGIVSNDDSRGPDSYFRFTVPADGEYVIRVMDHLGKGGVDYVYRIEFSPVKPTLTLGIPRVARYSQSRQTIYVPRGNRFATLLSASRANFGGELVLDPKGMPAGITIVAENMAANMSVMPVVFEAAADAPLSGSLVDFTARHVDPKQKISGGFRNRADFVIAAPGQSLYTWKDVDRLAVAVVDEVPFRLEIVQPKVPLVRNGSMQLKIVAHRKEGYDAAINVQLPFRPPGVGASSSVTIPKGKNEVLYPLNANGGAQIKKWRIYALGSADVGGAAWVSSQLATLEITAPYLTIAFERSSVEQGQNTEIFGKIQLTRAFEGNAKVRLVGLPHKVAAPEMVITKDTKELAFAVTSDKTSPAGNHKTVFAQVVITENGESVVHSNAGGTQLRIDKPLPPKPNAKPKPKPKSQPVAKKAAPKPPVKKRLTRLQKLRLEAKQRADGTAAEE